MSADSRDSILIVDDEPAIARALKRMLKDWPSVVVCTDAAMALTLLRAGTRFGAIVCDMHMPGMSGEEFYLKVREEFGGLERRIIFMTGGVSTDDATAFLAGVENTCVSKPISRSTLEHAVRRICSSVSADGASLS